MKLHFGDLQQAVAILFAILAALIAAIFALVALKSRSDVPLERVQQTGYVLRRSWLAFLVTLLMGGVGLSLFFFPYASGSAPKTVVDVTGGQFYWSMSDTRLPAHQRVRFKVTSADVNHGFGVYDPDGQLLGSVQAMPGYTNKLDLTFDRPGEYLVSCLEFCGVHHHKMARTFQVAER